MEYEKNIRRGKLKSCLKNVSTFANGGGAVFIFDVNDNEVLIGLVDAKDIS